DLDLERFSGRAYVVRRAARDRELDNRRSDSPHKQTLFNIAAQNDPAGQEGVVVPKSVEIRIVIAWVRVEIRHLDRCRGVCRIKYAQAAAVVALKDPVAEHVQIVIDRGNSVGDRAQ